MGWTPSPRPDWVLAINRGEVAPIAEEAALPLTRDALVAEAAARQGLHVEGARAVEAAFGHKGFPAEPALERLDRFLAAVDAEAQLNPMGRWMTRRFLLRLLEVRTQLMSWLRQDPGVQEEAISTPLFVAGAPRTGTTILHTLLAADARHRVPKGWELLRPVPPPSPDPMHSATDPRIGLADRELVRPQTVVSGLLSIHEYGGHKPKECLSAQSFAFLSEEFTARFGVPRFEAWLESADMDDAYRMHRLVLQVLQRGHHKTHWVLKSPVHLHHLPTLFGTYPDAKVAITHRDPLVLLASLTSLIANLRWSHSDEVDPAAIASAHVKRYARTFENLVDWTEAGVLPEKQIHHSRFADFQDRPIETVRALYARFDESWSEDAERAMRSTLAKHPSDRLGSHAYSAEDLGTDPVALRGRFQRYQQAFDVPSND
jgi:hypothetical protein